MASRVTFLTDQEHELRERVLRLRTAIFVERSGWPLAVENGCEIDSYDTSDTIYAALFHDDNLCGTFRATRTDHPYLTAEIFSQLAVLQSFPHAADVWEISRFGVLGGGSELNLGRVLYAAMFWFARQVGATALVATADLSYERFLSSLGIRTRRYGPPQVVGVDAFGRQLRAVAGEIPIAAQSSERLSALLSHLQHVEITDASQIFGPARISA